MANLIQRLTGDIAGGDGKIAIHAFSGAFNEWGRGKVTAASVVAAFSLDASQQSQAQSLASLWAAAPDKTRFMRVFKDLMYMGETNIHANYRDISFINSRLQEEVTDQGGTLP